MPTADKTLVALEKKFWQSMVDEDTDTALSLLHEPALMVSSQGAMQFGHAEYREMAETGSMVIKSFELSDMNVIFPNDDTALLTYRVRQAMAGRGEDESEAVEQVMADSSVWTRKDGEWRCVMHTETEVESADDEDDEGGDE
ncbi:MAG: nuclear transport factor 2 family protein [Rubrivivax sp.]|nr:MAG: nuclear transport factor 2 family protein [Rubrivivax sp.]